MKIIIIHVFYEDTLQVKKQNNKTFLNQYIFSKINPGYS